MFIHHEEKAASLAAGLSWIDQYYKWSDFKRKLHSGKINQGRLPPKAALIVPKPELADNRTAEQMAPDVFVERRGLTKKVFMSYTTNSAYTHRLNEGIIWIEKFASNRHRSAIA